jgi:hypothetical protein
MSHVILTDLGDVEGREEMPHSVENNQRAPDSPPPFVETVDSHESTDAFGENSFMIQICSSKLYVASGS